MLVIHDLQIVKQLEALAEHENRPVEDVLKTMLAQYVPPTAIQPSSIDKPESVKRVRRKAYAKARQYWETVGDKIKAALTDQELDQQFARFDHEGIPRLKSDLGSVDV